MRRNPIFNWILAILLLFVFAGCAGAPPPKQEVKKPEPPPAPALDYDAMVKRSLVSAGNNVRIKAAIAKAKAGKKVTIAYIGGSITEGIGASSLETSYVSLATASFKSLFGSGRTLNAGMSGTPSSLGLIRYQRDVVQKIGSNPDIVVIDFAVNEWNDPTKGVGYESLVRDILAAKNAPAVVFLFSVFPTQYNTQDWYIPVGKAYGLPMISIKDAIVPELTSGALTVKKFFADEYHPKDYGHQLMADCMSYYFKTVDAAAADTKDASLPDKAVIGKQYQGMAMIDSARIPAGAAVKPGSFTEKDTALFPILYAPTQKSFPDNWHKKDPNANEPFTMTLVCRSLFLVYKQSDSNAFGTVDIAVDGKLVKSLKGNGGWNNPVPEIIIDADKAAKHVVSIKMTDASAAKSFSILAFGFTK